MVLFVEFSGLRVRPGGLKHLTRVDTVLQLAGQDIGIDLQSL